MMHLQSQLLAFVWTTTYISCNDGVSRVIACVKMKGHRLRTLADVGWRRCICTALIPSARVHPTNPRLLSRYEETPTTCCKNALHVFSCELLQKLHASGDRSEPPLSNGRGKHATFFPAILYSIAESVQLEKSVIRPTPVHTCSSLVAECINQSVTCATSPAGFIPHQIARRRLFFRRTPPY